MGKIISNGNSHRICRYSGSILRTPLTLALSPDDRAYYSVAGGYSGSNPNTGWILPLNYNNCVQVGSDCIKCALNPTTPSQYWRQVTNNHDPEFVWYQGAYSTSAPNIATGLLNCEAYWQACGYHFTIPSKFANFTVSKVTVSFMNGGGILCYKSPLDRSSNNRALKGIYQYTTFKPKIQCASQLGHPLWMSNNFPYDDKVDLFASPGPYKGARDLWGRTTSGSDGGIPTFTTPKLVSYEMGANTLAAFNTNRGGWLVTNPNMVWSSNTNYSPYFWPNLPTEDGYWACVSMWGFNVRIMLDA